MTTRAIHLTLRYFDTCPSWQTTYQRLRSVLDEGGLQEARIELERVETTEDADRLRFVGSPTVLIDGEDAFPVPSDTYGLTCRVYETPEGFAGSPTTDQLRRVVEGR